MSFVPDEVLGKLDRLEKKNPLQKPTFKKELPASDKALRVKVGDTKYKLTQRFLDAIQKDFNAFGEEALEAFRLSDPGKYIMMLASFVPKEAKIDMSAEGTITHEHVNTEQTAKFLSDLVAQKTNDILNATDAVYNVIDDPVVIVSDQGGMIEPPKEEDGPVYFQDIVAPADPAALERPLKPVFERYEANEDDSHFKLPDEEIAERIRSLKENE